MNQELQRQAAAYEPDGGKGGVLPLRGVELRLTAEYALRAAIDSGLFASLRELEPLDGGHAVQSVYVALLRRLPNVTPDRRRIAIDSGYSESSVKRAIKLLELCGLISVKRAKGRCSVYHVADIRMPEVASGCMAEIKLLVRRHVAGSGKGSRVTSEPTAGRGRVRSGPSGRATSALWVGSQVAQKEARKISSKQQVAACESVRAGECDTERVLSRWGLSSARYLVTPGDGRAIPELTEHPERAAMILDATLRQASWSSSAGVGAKVSFLRKNVKSTASRVAATQTVRRGWDATEERLANERAGDELRRESFERVLQAMPDEEFTACCERMFVSQPGLRKLFGRPSRDSSGLRLKLIEFLGSESEHGARREVSVA